jgi:Na+-driven multidrug efflux pump
MSLGLPSISMLCLEWWSFELMILYSAYISLQATAAQILLFNTLVICFMPAMGLQYAATTVIARSIG